MITQRLFAYLQNTTIANYSDFTKRINCNVPFQKKKKNPPADLIDLFSTLDSNEIFHISKLNNLGGVRLIQN